MKKYIVRLTEAEREFLENLVKKGKSAASKINRGRILLKADENQEKGGWTDKDIGLFRLNYAELRSRCQHIRQRNRKLSKFLKP